MTRGEAGLCAHSDGCRTVFSVPAAVTPMVQDNVVAESVVDSSIPVATTPIIGSPMA
jgi:hypothetical protein